MTRPRTWPAFAAAVAALTALGFALRVATFDQSFMGDELSTLWIVNDHSLGDVLSLVRSDDEITPPLYFVLGWLSLKLGSGPEWVRLPSLLAGVATIPMVYLLGARTVGRLPGLIAAAVLTLSPLMIFYSVEARAYALMIALVTASTLALLAAIRTGRTRWWVVYAACSCGALLSHYTSVFPLAAQFAWVIWAHRRAIRPLILANLGVLVGFAAWIPGFLADNGSWTQAILGALSPFTLDGVRDSLATWAFGYPYVELSSVPGRLAIVLLTGGALIALVAAGVRGVRAARSSGLSLSTALRRIGSGPVLIAALALAAPLGTTLYSVVGGDIMNMRNLNPSWPGLAVAIGAVLTAAGPIVGVACGAAVLAGLGIGVSKALTVDHARIDFRGAAQVVEQRSEPGDPVIDAAGLTPVPLTGLEVYLPPDRALFHPGLPVSEHAFRLGDPVPPPEHVVAQAAALGRGGSIYVVVLAAADKLDGEQALGVGADVLRQLRPDFEVVARHTLRGVVPLVVIELDERERGG